LQQSDISNNYEYAYWNLARFFYAERYGSPLEQMENLQLALGESIVRPEYESYLGDDAQLLRRRLFELQINNRRYAEGLATVELMRQRGDDEGVALFDEALTQLEVLRSNDQAYGLTGQLGEDGLWFVDLFKDDFYLDDLSGKVEELKLRCEGSYVFFDFDPEVQYHVSERAGECTLEIVGDPDTTFTLVQA
jgi:hypothetical protein